MPVPDKLYVTTDAVTFALDASGALCLLLVQRANEPYRGRWALPGGFVDEDEDLPDACARELREETGVRPAALAQIGAWGKPGRDPRGRNVTVAYLAVARPGGADAVAGDDAASAAWHPVDSLPPMAFDHDGIARAGLERLRLLAGRTHLLFAFLPDRFDLAQLRAASQAVLGRAVSDDETAALIAHALLEAAPGPEGEERLFRRAARDFMEPLAG